MKIQNKIVTIILGSLLIYGIGALLIQYTYLKPEFALISNNLAKKDVTKSIEAIDRELEHLRIFTKDYAIWDDCYEYVAQNYPTFIENNLTSESMTSAELSLVAILNNDHQLLFGQWSPSTSIWEPFTSSDWFSFDAYLPRTASVQTGLIYYHGEVYLVSIQPIFHTDATGPSNGLIVFGKRLGDTLNGTLLKMLNLHLELYPIKQETSSIINYAHMIFKDKPAESQVYLENQTQYAIMPLNDDAISGYVFLKDIKGKEILLLQTITDKGINILGKKFSQFSVLSILLCGVFIAILLIIFFRQVIVKPIEKLAKLISAFNLKATDPALNDEMAKRKDEIGNLAKSIQTMEQVVIEKHSEVLALNEKLDAKVLERTLALAKANESLLLSDTILNETSEGILIADHNMNIIRVNDALLKMTLYERSDLIGNTPTVFKSDYHDPIYYEQIWFDIKDKHHWSGEFWTKRQDGSLYPNLLSINVIHDPLTKATHYVALASDISHIKEAENTLEKLAYYDTLTGLPNRDLFYDRLDQAIKRTLRNDGTTALLFIDLDRFKNINDTLGHAVGDEVLVEVAKRLKERIRDSDTVSRLGGDEFTVILENVSHLVNVKFIADDLIQLLKMPITTMDRTVNISASIGIALVPDDDETVQGLVRKADAAMYVAKENGRGKICFTSLEIELRNRETMDLEESLRDAVAFEQFELYLQPKVKMDQGTIKISGAEALIRWRKPDNSMVSPDQFIPIAEETGLIHPIGKWVFEETCRFSKALNLMGWNLPLSVNLSVKQLERKDLLKEIKGIMEIHDIEPHHIQFELTENLFLKDLNQAQHILEEIKELGFQIAIDDFGKGYSSMSYIGNFPIDYLKIDKAFIDPIGQTNEKEVVSAIINIAKAHQFKTVAEGVETNVQKDFLIAHGCDEMQGYLFSKPLTFDDFVDYLNL